MVWIAFMDGFMVQYFTEDPDLKPLQDCKEDKRDVALPKGYVPFRIVQAGLGKRGCGVRSEEEVDQSAPR